MINRDQIIEQALTLPPEDRAAVAEALELSLAKEGFASRELARAWAEEIERRLAAYDRGETKAVDGTSLEQIREKLADRRAKKDHA